MTVLRQLRNLLADFTAVQYPPERLVESRSPRIHWFHRSVLQLFTVWLAIVGGVAILGMLWVAAVFARAWWQYG